MALRGITKRVYSMAQGMEKAANGRQHWPLRGKKYCLMVRMAILIKLLHEGHGRWVWATRAWFRILINDRFGNSSKRRSGSRHPNFLGRFSSITSCDYVCDALGRNKLECSRDEFCVDNFIEKNGEWDDHCNTWGPGARCLDDGQRPRDWGSTQT